MTDLIVKQKTEDMIAYGYVALRQFPKAERHVLSQEVRQSMWRLLRLIIVCHRKYYKKTTLQDLDVELDVLRAQLRLAQSLGYLPMTKYEIWSKHLCEIGRMIGGWIKSTR